MWLSEGFSATGLVRTLRFGAAAAAMAVLAACQVAPVYGPTAQGSSVADELAAIQIEPVNDRISQVVRNELITAFGRGAGETVAPRYDMRLTVTTTGGIEALTRDQIKPIVTVNLSVSFDLIERSTNRQIARGTARASASYTRLNQGFANNRARVDAETRAAVAAAEDIRLRVASILAGGR